MEPYEELLLKLIRSSILQSEEDFSEFSDFADWSELFELCRVHSVVGMIYDKLIEVFGDKIPEQYSMWFKHRAFKEMSFQAVRSLAFEEIYRELAVYNLSPVVLKGEVLRGLYPKPESRTSLDEDLLIDEKDYPVLEKALTAMGFEEVSLGEDDKHWLNKKYSTYFEIHFSPFAKEQTYENWNRVFENYQERTMRNRKGVVSLSRDDNLIFLILHATNHFIYSGVGIKQLLDIALFIREYRNEINFSYVNSMLRKAKVMNFAGQITAFIQEYLYPETVVFGTLRVDEEFVHDVLAGGSLGKADEARVHSANVTISAFKGKSSLKKILFPPKNRLQLNYPFAKKHPILLPIAWFIRLFSYLKLGKKTLKKGSERLKMIQKYGLIEK